MATCGKMVEGNVVSFACDIQDPNHDGPCRAIENDRSVRERKKWEDQKRHDESGLGAFQGVAQTTAEAYTENPTPVPGPRPEPVQDASEDTSEVEDRATAVVVTKDQDGRVHFKQASSAEAKVAGVPEYLATKAKPSFRRRADLGCGACCQGDHAHCQFIEDNVGAVDAQDFIDCYCDCFKAAPGMHEVFRAEFEEREANPLLAYDPEDDSVTPAEPTKQREGDQALPQPTGDQYVQDRIIAKVQALVETGGMDQAQADDIIAKMEESKQVGIRRYGTPLQTFNGRDCLQDAVEEARDLYVYLSSMEQAREASRDRLIEVVTQALVAHAEAMGEWAGAELEDAAGIAVDAILNATGGFGSGR